MFTCDGVISSTSVKTVNAGRNVVAPNGDIKAETETRKMIHIFAPFDQTEYGGPETCLCNSSGRPFFSMSTSFEKSTGPEASSRDTSELDLVVRITACNAILAYDVVEARRHPVPGLRIVDEERC
jgi:hypothetical protein